MNSYNNVINYVHKNLLTWEVSLEDFILYKKLDVWEFKTEEECLQKIAELKKLYKNAIVAEYSL